MGIEENLKGDWSTLNINCEKSTSQTLSWRIRLEIRFSGCWKLQLSFSSMSKEIKRYNLLKNIDVGYIISTYWYDIGDILWCFSAPKWLMMVLQRAIAPTEGAFSCDHRHCFETFLHICSFSLLFGGANMLYFICLMAGNVSLFCEIWLRCAVV